jgi:hypothetical protein
MIWIKSTDRFPTLREEIFLAKKNSDSWDFMLSKIRRPYDWDKEYNESYYEFFNTRCIEWIKVPNEFFWIKIKNPQEE